MGQQKGTSRLANATQIKILGRKRESESMGKERHSVTGASRSRLKHVLKSPLQRATVSEQRETFDYKTADIKKEHEGV